MDKANGRGRVLKICKKCNNEFITWRSQKPALYCSRSCSSSCKIQPKSERSFINCLVCNIEFKDKKSKLTKRKTCSRICGGRLYSINYKNSKIKKGEK